MILGDGIFNFNSKYKIDIGEELPVEVSKLKLYKFDRDEQIPAGPTNSGNERLEIIPHEDDSKNKSGSNIPDPTPPEPVTLEEAKREVAEALKEIWKLPVSERSSAIKRLIRKWHPDKNMHRESFANEVSKFLLNEVDRLKNGGIPGYQPDTDSSKKSRMDRPSSGSSRRTSSRTSSRQSKKPSSSSSEPTWDGPDFKDYFDNCRGRRKGRTRGNGGWQDADNENEPANRNEAERWMRQAHDDLDGADCLFRNAHYSLTCFHCQQAVEKGLKALMFAKGRLKKSDLEAHDVMALAYRATGMDRRLQTVPRMVERITRYYLNTRYPEYQRGFFRSSIPAETYSQEDAADAITNAKEILRLFQQVLN